jgi:SAM-dependent methyltransferase
MSRVQAYAALFGEADRRCPGSDELSRRIARLCTVGPGARVLVLQSGPGRTARILAREYGCNVVCVDDDPAGLDLLRARAKGDGVESRIEARAGTLQSLAFADEEFDAAVAEGLQWQLSEAASSLRRVLATNGRLCVTAPCRVGLNVPQAVLDFWAQRLGYPLTLPAALMQALERGGYEPLACEAMPDILWDEYYRVVEAGLPKLTNPEFEPVARVFRQEIDVFQREGGRHTVTYALIVARRKEPNEKPPPARTR